MRTPQGKGLGVEEERMRRSGVRNGSPSERKLAALGARAEAFQQDARPDMPREDRSAAVGPGSCVVRA